MVRHKVSMEMWNSIRAAQVISESFGIWYGVSSMRFSSRTDNKDFHHGTDEGEGK